MSVLSHIDDCLCSLHATDAQIEVLTDKELVEALEYHCFADGRDDDCFDGSKRLSKEVLSRLTILRGCSKEIG